MNNVVLHRKPVAPLWAFEPKHLQCGAALDDALDLCLGAINSANFEPFAEDLLSKPNLLQLFVSGKSEIYSTYNCSD